MAYDPNKHHRRFIRLKGHDYAQAGAYFITIVARDRVCLFGEVADAEMHPNDAGRIVDRCWRDIPAHFPNFELDAFVVMPNHVHGIIVMVRDPPVGATHASPLPDTATPRGPKRQSLGAVVGSFKSAASKYINALYGNPDTTLWQRNYYEHVIREEESLNRIRQYILHNPVRWAFDRENPEAVTPEPEHAWLA